MSQGPNLYQYVWNGPVDCIDPSGLNVYFVNRGHQWTGVTDPNFSTGISWYDFGPDADHLFDNGNLWPFGSPGEWRKCDSLPSYTGGFIPLLDGMMLSSSSYDANANAMFTSLVNNQPTPYNLVYNCWTAPAAVLFNAYFH